MSWGPMDELKVLHRRLGGMVTRGTVTNTNDSAKCQTLQVKIAGDECTQDCENFQPYGFTSQALAGAEAIVASIAGVVEHRVVLAVTDRRGRPKVAAGESAQWDDQGQLIAIRRGGIVLDAAGRPDGIKLGASASLGAARATDPVNAGTTMAAWLAAVTAKCNALPGPPVPTLADFGAIASGSPVVKIA